MAFKVYEDSLMSGLSDDDAAIAAANALKAGSFASSAQAPTTSTNVAGTMASDSPAATTTIKLAEVTLNVQKIAIKVKRENGRVYWILLKPESPIDTHEFENHPAVNALTNGYFFNDPRTQLYMTQSSGPNDPALHTATLLFPMNTQTTYLKGGYYSFNHEGEDPVLLKDALLKAGYSESDILVQSDGQVTPKTIADELLKNPSVFYISSHGMHDVAHAAVPEQFVMVTGAKVTVAPGQTRDAALSAAVVALGLPAYLQNTIVPVDLKVDRFNEETFLGVGRDFFEALKANNPGWNMAKSLVYLDACSSTARANEDLGIAPTDADVPLSRALFNNPAVLIGWMKPSDPLVAARYSQHFFENAARKTHSAREVWDETWRVLNTRYRIYEEDDRLDDPDRYKRVALKEEYAKLRHLGPMDCATSTLGMGCIPTPYRTSFSG